MTEQHPELPEFEVVVAFEVEAESREEAHRALAEVLDWRRAERHDGIARKIKQVMNAMGVIAWHFPEADVKHIDGNDRAARHLELDEPS